MSWWEWILWFLWYRYRYLKPPRNVQLQQISGRPGMANAKLTWTKSPSSSVNQYSVQWMLDNNPAAQVPVPSSTNGDASGYSTDFNSGNPGVTLNNGDIVGATLTAVDTINNLQSTPVTPSPITISIPTAPSPPENVVLAQDTAAKAAHKAPTEPKKPK